MFEKLVDIFNELRPKQLIALAGVAAILMFGVVYAALSALHQQEIEEVQQAIATRTVVVAKTDIYPMETIQKDMVEKREVMLENIPDGAITDLSSVVGSVAKKGIVAGDILTASRLYETGEVSGMAGTIPAECRAISVGVSDITGVAGFAKSGNHVDVLLVEKHGDEAKTTLLLQNVLLLGVNKNMLEKKTSKNEEVSGREQSQESPSIATLALLPSDIMKLASASKMGEICLVLRPFRPSQYYVSDSEYTYTASRATSVDAGTGGGEGTVSGSTAGTAARPVPAFTPPPSPVKGAAVPSAGAVAAAPAYSFGGMEIIQGDKVVQ